MSNGKPYYARSDTNETVWDIPPEIAERMKQYESVSNPPAAPLVSPTSTLWTTLTRSQDADLRRWWTPILRRWRSSILRRWWTSILRH
jgi:hypothetical protein